jgi:hypothetical protein
LKLRLQYIKIIGIVKIIDVTPPGLNEFMEYCRATIGVTPPGLAEVIG